MLHRCPIYCSRIICSIKYNLALQRQQILSLKRLPLALKSTTTLFLAWWLHTAMAGLFPWPTRSGKATQWDFALSLETWYPLGREPSGRSSAFTSVWAGLAFPPMMSVCTQGHRSWDEGNSNQRTSSRRDNGMHGVTLPPCGELPLETNKERWLTSK